MKTKKILSILTALIVAIMFFAPIASMAATVTVTGDVQGRTFEVYKLFTLTPKTDNYYYTWDDTTTKAKDYMTTLKYDGTNLITDEYQAVEYLSGFDSDSLDLANFAKEFAANVEHDSTITAGTPVTLTDGYYLLYDTGAKNPVSSAMLVTVTGEKVNVTLKAETVEVKKEADAQTAFVGEEINYTVTTKVPNTVGFDLNTYVFKVTDTMSSGLTYNSEDGVGVTVQVGTINDAEEFVEEKTLVWGKDYVETFAPATNSLEVDLNKYLKTAQADFGKTIKITYSATVNSNAVDTSAGENSVKITYSNNPNSTSQGIETPEKVVDVYTYSINFTKKSPFGVNLPGATFKLQYNDNGTYKYVVVAENGDISLTTNADDAEVYTSDAAGLFAIEGLKAGDYKLVEITAPEGYDLPNFESFNFSINHTEGTKTATLVSNLEGAPADYLDITDETFDYADASNRDAFDAIVLNAKASILPSTGGVGTTIFTVVGISLMVAAAVVFVVRNRKED